MDFDFANEWNKPESFRAQSVVGSFTLTDVKLQKRFKGSLPIEDFEWKIGVIVGRSATGKTTLSKKLFPNAFVDPTQFKHSSTCMLDDFPADMETNEITKLLCSVGFASPPDWLKPYAYLSSGEKMRVDLALALCLDQQVVAFDEFTSVVDREVGKMGSIAVSKAVRRMKDKRFIAITCHYDVVDWLDPDWVFCTDTMEFDRKKETGRPLNSKFTGAASRCGRCFGSFTI